MSAAIAHTRRIAVNPVELVRVTLVCASALALILAGQALPF